MMPVLPKLVSRPGCLRSTRATDQPRRCKCSADATPTLPAPRTMTLRMIDGLQLSACFGDDRDFDPGVEHQLGLHCGSHWQGIGEVTGIGLVERPKISLVGKMDGTGNHVLQRQS